MNRRSFFASLAAAAVAPALPPMPSVITAADLIAAKRILDASPVPWFYHPMCRCVITPRRL